MICSQCGEENKPEAKFCNGCGAEIVVEEVEAEEAVAVDVEEVSENSTPKKKKPSKGLVALIGIAALVIAGVLLFVYEPPEETEAIQSVRMIQSDLKDPNSIQLHSVKITKSTSGAFGYEIDYSAKNSFGGMVRKTERYSPPRKDGNDKLASTVELNPQKISKAVNKKNEKASDVVTPKQLRAIQRLGNGAIEEL